MKLSCANAKDIEYSWSHFFLYGPTGAGKTEAASTWPQPVFIVPYNEQSIATLKGRDVAYYELTNMTDKLVGNRGGLGPILDELFNAYQEDPDSFPFQTIVIESISHYLDLVVDEISQGGRRQMDQRHWGSVLAHFRNTQSRLRNMQVHVVFTALAEIYKDKEGNITGGGPMISGATAKKLPSACDVIGYCEYKPGAKNVPPTYRIHFRDHGIYPARARFRGWPGSVDNFHFDKVNHLLRGADSPLGSEDAVDGNGADAGVADEHENDNATTET